MHATLHSSLKPKKQIHTSKHVCTVPPSSPSRSTTMAAVNYGRKAQDVRRKFSVFLVRIYLEA